jgi:hypothetical protein
MILFDLTLVGRKKKVPYILLLSIHVIVISPFFPLQVITSSFLLKTEKIVMRGRQNDLISPVAIPLILHARP